MTLTRRAIAATFVLVGLLMLVGGPSAYTSPSYTVLFEVAGQVAPSWVEPTTVWGVGFIVVGLTGGLWARRQGDLDAGLVLMIGLLAAWSLGLWTAVWPRQVATTWGGPAWPTLVTVILLLNVGRVKVR